MVSNEGIKTTTLKYCLKVLENNEPTEGVKELVSLKEEAHKMRMNERVVEEDTEISEEEFFSTLAKFESKNSPTYNFIVNSGLKFRMAIFKLCKRFIDSEEFPSSFDVTTLIQLLKKGSQLFLDNSRFIHMKLWLPRLCEALTVRKTRDDII